ncbi:MAG: DNA primase [Candidatus Calescibacterium sp.]|nr:DNA primase [Candidatus Calescibacterium sp.]MDW8132132.1 DNA primase [Candidatus Calescibacterium sp.]
MNDIILKIKRTVNYRDFFSSFLKLKKVGSTHMAVCPFHPDSQPSMSIDLEKGLWYCFGCNRGGDIFNFVMELENCSFFESVKFIADMLSIDIQEDSKFLKRVNSGNINHEIYKILADFYHNILLKSSIGSKARDYLNDRKIKIEVIQNYKLGYCPKNVENLKIFSQKKGIKMEELYEYGLLYKKGKDFYEILAGRIVIPIYAANGTIIGFSGREIDDSKVKYINTIGLVKTNTLYGINVSKNSIRSNGVAFLVEGYFDVWALYSSGYENSVGLMGTSISDKQIDIIKKYTDKVVLFMDSDKSGQDSTINNIINLVSHGLNVKIAVVREYKDPHEAYLNNPEIIKNINRFILEDITYMIGCYVNQPDIHQKQKFLERYVIPFLKAIRKKVVRDEYIKRFSLDTSVSYKYLTKMMSGYNKQISEEEEVIKKYGLEIYFLVFALVNFDLFKKFYENVDFDLFKQKDISSKLFKYLVECIKENVDPSEYIIHELLLTEVLKIVVKVSIDLDASQKESYFKKLINNLYKKFLMLELRDLMKRGEYEKTREIQEKLRKFA